MNEWFTFQYLLHSLDGKAMTSLQLHHIYNEVSFYVP